MVPQIEKIVRIIIRYRRIGYGVTIALLTIGVVGGYAYLKNPRAVEDVGERVKTALAQVPISLPDISPALPSPTVSENFEAKTIQEDILELQKGLAAVQEGYTHDANQRQELTSQFKLLTERLEEQRTLLQSKAATLDTAIEKINAQIATLNNLPAGTPATSGSSPTPLTSSKININTANASLLDSLPGIGPATAEKIIAYRTDNGLFKSIDDLANVSGISTAMVDKMRDQIEI